MARSLPPPISIPTSIVRVPEGRRPIDPVAYTRIRDSIERLGQQMPITVRVDDAGEFVLVAGLHRLRACEELYAPVMAMKFASEHDAREWEISENLIRAELSVDERRTYVAELIELQTAKESGPFGPKPPGRPRAGVRQLSRETGIPRSTIQRDLKAVANAEKDPPEPRPTPAAKQAATPRPAADPIEEEEHPEDNIDDFCAYWQGLSSRKQRAILSFLSYRF